MIKEILLVHHSHTDIGYTHPQPVVLELQRRFIDTALDYLEETADWPLGSRLTWTCEVTGVTLDWWRQASEEQQQRFLAAAARGQLEVAALQWNMTPLMDHQMLLDGLAPIEFFRSLGLTVRAAMNSDVNGLPWGTVDALLDHGVEGLSMAVNEHFGYAVQPRPRGFWWESPSGHKLLVWNGLIYGASAERVLSIPVDAAQAETSITKLQTLLDGKGYPHDFLMVQATHRNYHDNASPNLELARFVRAWNEDEHEVALKLVTLSEVFERLRAQPPEQLETLRGDWTDWWNFGSGSTAVATSLALGGQRLLRAAEQLRAWPGANLSQAEQVHDLSRQEALFERANEQLTLYAEHTWGADRSVWKHLSPETLVQQGLKLATAYEGYSLARLLQRDGLERLSARDEAGSTQLLLYNPLPFAVRRTVRLPEPDEAIRQLARKDSHLAQRQDVVLGDLDVETTHDWILASAAARYVGPVELPALGYVTLPLDALPEPQGEVYADETGMGNSRLEVRFDPDRGGLSSLRLDRVEFVRDAPWQFGQAVLEAPAQGSRQAIFGPPDYDTIDVHTAWHTDWEARREGPTAVDASYSVQAGRAEYRQTMHMPNGDKVTATYRLMADEASLGLEVVIIKQPIAAPHALYLAFPVALGPSARCVFETAGAVVELDKEQLPYSSGHYLTTQRFIALQDDKAGFSIACPDTPLWQVGGFTFGRHQDGVVSRDGATLLAWLTNNYWDTNFQADQGGRLHFRFQLLPQQATELDKIIETTLPYAEPPRAHYYLGRAQDAQRLLDLDLGGVILTGIKRSKASLTMFLLNPSSQTKTVSVGPGQIDYRKASRVNLAGQATETLATDAVEMTLTVEPRQWTGVRLDL